MSVTACCLACRREHPAYVQHQRGCEKRYEPTDEAGTPLSELHESDQARVLRPGFSVDEGGENSFATHNGTEITRTDDLGGATFRRYAAPWR